MLKFRKKAPDSGANGEPLALLSADNSLQCVFDTEVVNSFRHMATELACNGELPRRIAMIAALRGEGVTYTALALGTTLASDLGASVCVIELNWWAPGMLAQLDPAALAAPGKARRGKPAAPSPAAAAPRPGLAQVLMGAATLDEALIATERANLALLPAGDMPVTLRPSLARSESLRELIGALSERYDHLIFDVPAVLSTSDAIVLASLGDACAVIIRHGVTPTASVQRALDDLRHMTMLGVVFNRVSLKTPRWLQALIPQE